MRSKWVLWTGWLQSESQNVLPSLSQLAASGCDPFSGHSLSNDHLKSHCPEYLFCGSFSFLTDLSLAEYLNLLYEG